MDFFTITSEMTQDLKLKGNNLLIYAVIFNYSKNGNGICTASRNYLKNIIGASSLRTVDSSLEYLQNRGLIIKNEYTEKNTKYITYKAVKVETVHLKDLYNYLIQDFSSSARDLCFNGIKWLNNDTFILNVNMKKESFPENWKKQIERQLEFWNIQKKTSYNLKYGFKGV